MTRGDRVLFQVRAFGGLVERTGLTSLPVELPVGATVGDLRRTIAAAHPGVAMLLPRVAVAVDLEVVDDAFVLADGQEIALLPPVAGGAGDPEDASASATDGPPTLTGLVRGPFDVQAVLDRIGAPDVGATVSFLGTVRDHAADLDGVVRLEYTAYEEMAERELAVIALELRRAHPAVRGVALLHALGALAVEDHTVLVAVSSAHREEAFTACRWALEEIKTRVPVFKREVTADGAHRWVGLPGDPARD
jgi:molybdopterin synthase catalytic subunit/molybdopterin converting factor small subunit